ncbi:MAG: CDP-diacylglycerol--glycerol-3-phosphate 3-phosphatidyltransferase [Eubacteriales bacterium]|nr:CDP-diacylglycerol--glycerol-3-phosphate 3-phosphatidyltransferase [Eubacteriales bacterium]
MNLANKLTILRILMIPIMIVCFYLNWSMWVCAGVFILAAVTDLLDGRYARKHNICTDFGRFMDPIADKLLVCSALILLVEGMGFPSILAIVLIGREFVISGFRLVAAGNGTVISAGFMGKLKTVFQCIMIPWWLLQFEPIFSITPFISTLFIILMWVVTGISVFTSIYSCVEYIYKNRKVISFK